MSEGQRGLARSPFNLSPLDSSASRQQKLSHREAKPWRSSSNQKKECISSWIASLSLAMTHSLSSRGEAVAIQVFNRLI